MVTSEWSVLGGQKQEKGASLSGKLGVGPNPLRSSATDHTQFWDSQGHRERRVGKSESQQALRAIKSHPTKTE